MSIRLLSMVACVSLAWLIPIGMTVAGIAAAGERVERRLHCLDAGLAGRRDDRCRNEPALGILLTNPVPAG